MGGFSMAELMGQKLKVQTLNAMPTESLKIFNTAQICMEIEQIKK